MNIKILAVLSLLLLPLLLNAQTSNYQLGRERSDNSAKLGGLFDYSNPDGLNKKIAIWGYVKFPGAYIVPAEMSLFEIISLCGGPTTDAKLENVRIVRNSSDTTTIIHEVNLEDLVWEEEPEFSNLTLPEIKGGDAIIIPGQPRYFFREYLGIGLSIFSALISLSILLININK